MGIVVITDTTITIGTLVFNNYTFVGQRLYASNSTGTSIVVYKHLGSVCISVTQNDGTSYGILMMPAVSEEE